MLRRLPPLILAAFAVALATGAGASAQETGTRGRIGGGAAAGEPEGIRRYVFAGVAIDSFRIAEWPTLQNAVNDLRGVRSVLQEQYGFESPDEWILTNSAATQRGISDLLDALHDDDTGIQEGDALIFFFAGHGTGNDGRGFIVPHDIGKKITDAESHYVMLGPLIERLNLLPARHVLLIIDACKAGLALTTNDGLKEQLLDGELRRQIEEMANSPSRIVVTSAESDESAYDGNGPLLGHSLFTGYLIQGLERAASGTVPPDSLTTERGRVPAMGLFDYVQRRVAEASAALQEAQNPTVGAFMTRGDSRAGGTRGQMVLAFEVDAFDDAYAEAIRLDEADQTLNNELRAAVARALEAEDEESEAPRAWYLRYLIATLPDEEDTTETVLALRRLVQYATEGVALPPEAPRRRDLERALAGAEKDCRIDQVCVAAAAQ